MFPQILAMIHVSFPEEKRAAVFGAFGVMDGPGQGVAEMIALLAYGLAGRGHARGRRYGDGLNLSHRMAVAVSALLRPDYRQRIGRPFPALL
jgi:hypothetical protein